MSTKSEFRWRRSLPMQFLIYLFLRAVIMVINMFPVRMAPRIAKLLGGLLRTFDRKHVRIAVKNLERSRGVVEPDAIPEFIDRVYGHVGLGLVEMLMLPRLMERRELSRFVKMERFHVWDELLKEGRGVITAMGHLGNWELCGLGVTQAGYPLNSLYRPPENRWAARYLDRFRTQTGLRTISKYNALGEMIRVIRRNEILVIQIDQDARHSGVYVDFFGRPASTHRSAAVLSLKYGTPIVFAEVYREGGLHHVRLSDPIRPEAFRDRPDPVRALTQELTARLEQSVRAHPEQWFWVHDRWKTAERVARIDAQAVA